MTATVTLIGLALPAVVMVPLMITTGESLLPVVIAPVDTTASVLLFLSVGIIMTVIAISGVLLPVLGLMTTLLAVCMKILMMPVLRLLAMMTPTCRGLTDVHGLLQGVITLAMIAVLCGRYIALRLP